MSETSDGARAPNRENSNWNDSGNNNNNNNSNKRRHNKHSGRSAGQDNRGFQGKCADLKSAVYDVTAGRDTFTKTTRDIAEYIGREYEDAGEFRIGMVDLELPPIVAPAEPDDANNMLQLERWKIQTRLYEKKTETRRKNSGRAYPLILGQCSQALRNRMEADVTWNNINENSDVIALLQLIQTCMIQRQTRKNAVHTLLDAQGFVPHIGGRRNRNDILVD